MTDPPPGDGGAGAEDMDANPGTDIDADDTDAHIDAEIDESSDESFPASDAPQWWSGPNDHRR